MTAAAHRAVAERARASARAAWPTRDVRGRGQPSRSRRCSCCPHAASREGPATKPASSSLPGTTVAIYNAAGIDGLASSASQRSSVCGARPLVDTRPGVTRYSTVVQRHRATPRRRGGSRRHSGSSGQPPGKPPRCPTAGPSTSSWSSARTSPSPRRACSTLSRSCARRPTARSSRRPAPSACSPSRAGLCLEVRDEAGLGRHLRRRRPTRSRAGRCSRSAPRDGRLRGAFGLVPDGVDTVELGQADGRPAGSPSAATCGRSAPSR